jgi:hypothetical protein
MSVAKRSSGMVFEGGEPFHSTEEPGVTAASDLYPTVGSEVDTVGRGSVSETGASCGLSFCLALFARRRLELLLLRLCRVGGGCVCICACGSAVLWLGVVGVTTGLALDDVVGGDFDR